MTKMLALVSFPLLIGLVSVSDAFITAVFGEKWLAAVPILNVLAIVGILRVLMNPNGSVLLAKGRADLAFYWDWRAAAVRIITVCSCTDGKPADCRMGVCHYQRC